MLVLFSCPHTLLLAKHRNVCNEYLDKLTCIVRKYKSDIFIIGTDANSSMRTASARSDVPVGYFLGKIMLMNRENFSHLISASYVAVITTFLKKKRYSTWIHPCSKMTNQTDHFIINKEMLHRCIDSC